MRMIDEAALINEAETGGWDVDIKELKMILKYVPDNRRCACGAV